VVLDCASAVPNRVTYYLINAQNQKVEIGNSTTQPYGISVNSARLANGKYRLLAVANYRYNNVDYPAPSTPVAINIENRKDLVK
jgi:hypothetical protein